MTYSSPLSLRYASPAMQALWGERRRIGLWRRLWHALMEAERELGLDVEGNTINLPTRELFSRWQARGLPQQFFEEPARYLHSSFPNMADWTIAWWDKVPGAGAYPDFYLRHCCGFAGSLDRSLPIEPDRQFRAAASGRKVIALSMSGSSASKQYRNARALRGELERAGHFVWSQFDGSAPLHTTLARLAVTDLLVSVATSTQWLARLVGCPTLVLPGALPAGSDSARYKKFGLASTYVKAF